MHNVCIPYSNEIWLDLNLSLWFMLRLMCIAHCAMCIYNVFMYVYFLYKRKAYFPFLISEIIWLQSNWIGRVSWYGIDIYHIRITFVYSPSLWFGALPHKYSLPPQLLHWTIYVQLPRPCMEIELRIGFVYCIGLDIKLPRHLKNAPRKRKA